MTLLLKSNYEEPEEWRRRLAELLPGVQLRVWPELGAAGDITMLAVDGAIPDGLLPRLPNLKCIQYLGHGAADALGHPERPGHVTVSRLTDPGIIGTMTEYALTALLRPRRQSPAGGVVQIHHHRSGQVAIDQLNALGLLEHEHRRCHFGDRLAKMRLAFAQPQLRVLRFELGQYFASAM